MLARSIVLSLVLSMPVATAQSQKGVQDNKIPIPTLKTKVRLVLVDVVVTNNKGELVPGLTKADFEISEDGIRQTISARVLRRGTSTIRFHPFVRRGLSSIRNHKTG